MVVTSLLVEAANLLVIGMVVVFCFLAMLIGCITAMKIVVNKFGEPSHTETATIKPTPSAQIQPTVVAAITAAVAQYRQSR